MPGETEAKGLLEVAAWFINPSGYSMTMAREESAEAVPAGEKPNGSEENRKNE